LGDGQEERFYQRCKQIKQMAVKLDTEWLLPKFHLVKRSEIQETAKRQLAFNTNGSGGGRCK
jgi:hypothetical protein